MVPFAGYEMPVQYPTGVLAEHLHTRAHAGLFDVSHMGQVRIGSNDRAVALEGIVPGDIRGLAPGRQRYTMFTNETGGILDDIMVANVGDHLFVVVNAACKEADVAHMMATLTPRCTVEALPDRALLALQGPAAARVMEHLAPGASRLGFMAAHGLRIRDKPCLVSRSGYTGEDGFEIALAANDAAVVAHALLAEPEVALIGLGARDSLRLEAGLCLYGHDIDPTTTPVEADLAWTISRRRREEGGFPGARIVQQQLRAGVARRRVGIRPADR
ncbi:MAG: glycine cleavage system aminomethyltransferase GcvT, partial [Alphaproteobacteria bacterium]|nr:glycine cleavage system aminomethyltransferase GcvT [Alphaproteobacteria bacterium]